MPPRLPLPQETYSFLKKLSSINLTPTALRLTSVSEGYGWTRKRTTRALTHYMMFLTLIQTYPNTRLVPTWDIDQVWQQHILSNTYQYEKDCRMLFGRMIHHISDTGGGDEKRWQAFETAFANTKVLFKKHFGVTL